MFISVEHRTTCTIPPPHDRALAGCDRDGKVSKYLFANEKKICNEIKYITQTKYMQLVNCVS